MKARILIATAAAALLPLAAAVAADNDQYGKEKDKSTMPDSAFKKLDSQRRWPDFAGRSGRGFHHRVHVGRREWRRLSRQRRVEGSARKGSASPTPQSAPSPS